MAEEKKIKKKEKIRAKLNQGWKDVDKIAEATGAKVGTVKYQIYLFRKEQGLVKPKKSKAVKE